MSPLHILRLRGLRITRVSVAALAFALVGAAAQAQTAPPSQTPPVTTKILAIGHATDTATLDGVRAVMPAEVRATVRLYLKGRIDQWYVREDQNGVVFLLNAGSVTEAKALLEQLPLGKAKLMEFDFVPLGPLSPLGILLTP